MLFVVVVVDDDDAADDDDGDEVPQKLYIKISKLPIDRLSGCYW